MVALSTLNSNSLRLDREFPASTKPVCPNRSTPFNHKNQARTMVSDNLISAPYGTWKSPITAEAISKNANAIEEILVDAITSKIYHLERRPSEGGRSVLVDTAAGRDLVPRSFNVRTGVQEYGGSAALVHNGVAWFSNYEDGRIYKVGVKEGEEEEPVAISPADRPYRFANITFHPTHPELLVAVLEDHTVDEASSVVTSICVVDTHSKTIVNQNLVSSGTADSFYALPRFTPDGKKLAWMYWTHPDMPWQGAEIHIGDVELTNSSGLPSLGVKNIKKISGEKGKVSACYLLFASDSTLLFTNDETGWVAPWKYDFGSSGEAVAKPLLSLERDFGEPMWSLGNQFPYTVVNGGREVLWVACKGGRHVLHHIEIATGNAKEIETPYVEVICPATVQGKEGEAVIFGGVKVDEKKTIVRVSVSSLLSGSPNFETNILPPPAEASTPVLSKDLVSVPQPIALELPNNEGPLHIVFYPPSNPQYSGSSVEGEKPPCVISVHGGPTGHEPQGLNWRKQYFTTRGWAWVDVNYRGSSAYGRDYIARLDGDWGVVDVQDCISTVGLLSSPPYSLVDGKRCTIRGGSAGGYTTLAALSLPKSVNERKVFAAAQSSYGVSDLKKLEEFTHKFESRYLEALLIGKQGEGKWNNAQERAEVLEKINKERSPIFWIDNIEVPLLILQGEVDKVVPKEQAELMYEKLKAKGGIVEYKLYPGEGHGWRQEVHLKDSLEREIGFYEKVLGLDVQN